MSLYSEYVKEREGSQVVEKDWGFFEFKILKDNNGATFIYIISAFISLEHRDNRVYPKSLHELMEKTAKSNKCKYAMAQVDLSTNTATDALHFHFHCGMKLHNVVKNIIYTKKELNYDI